MNAVLVPSAILGCSPTLDGGSACRERRRAHRPAHIISLLLGLAAVLLVLSPTAVEAGDAIAWGWNSEGQGEVPPEAQSDVIAVAGGYQLSLVLKDTGEVIAWGHTWEGQCDVPPEAQSGVIAIASGSSHGLALKDGGVIAWGFNGFGQCNVPPEAESGIIAIASGSGFSLALTDTGGVIAGAGTCGVSATFRLACRVSPPSMAGTGTAWR